MDKLLAIAIFTYTLAAIVMFCIPECWLPKKRYHEETGTSEEAYKMGRIEKGYYRKVFLLSGLGILAILLIVMYFMG